MVQTGLSIQDLRPRAGCVGLIFTVSIWYKSEEFSQSLTNTYDFASVTCIYGKTCDFDKYKVFTNAIATCVKDIRICNTWYKFDHSFH